MMAEILAGPLVGAAFAGIGNSKQNWGHLILAIDPNLLGDDNEFIENVGRMIEKIKATKKLSGVEKIFVPGERGAQLFRQCHQSGEIDIEENLLQELRIAAKGK
jgi:LDH2 family malate/lactate/ureidoglycolate dehydrogenase